MRESTPGTPHPSGLRCRCNRGRVESGLLLLPVACSFIIFLNKKGTTALVGLGSKNHATVTDTRLVTIGCSRFRNDLWILGDTSF